MITNEVIRILRKNDPTGDMHVCVNNDPIVQIRRLAGYYRGPYGFIEEDGEYYYPEQLHITDKFDKINIRTYSLKDYLHATGFSLDNVTIDVCPQYKKLLYEEIERHLNDHINRINELTMREFRGL